MISKRNDEAINNISVNLKRKNCICNNHSYFGTMNNMYLRMKTKISWNAK